MNQILDDDTKLMSLNLKDGEHIKVSVVNSQRFKQKFPKKNVEKNNLNQKSDEHSQNKIDKDSDGSDLSYNEKGKLIRIWRW